MAEEKEKVHTRLEFSGNAQKTRFIELVDKYNKQEPKLKKKIQTDMGATFISPRGAEVIIYALEEVTGTEHPVPKKKKEKSDGKAASEEKSENTASE